MLLTRFKIFFSSLKALKPLTFFQEKKELLTKLKKKDAELDQVNILVINELKAQLKSERHKLEKVK